MYFLLEIRSDNAAMVDAPREELARMLEETARKIREGADDGTLRDVNGNKVGAFGLNIY